MLTICVGETGTVANEMEVKMKEDNLDNIITSLHSDLNKKCDRVTNIFPNLEIKNENSKNDITYAINLLRAINDELDNVIFLHEIEIFSKQGMKKLEYIFNNIIDKSNKVQRNKLEELLKKLKTIYKIPAVSLKEMEEKLNGIQNILNQIDDFQNELSCKTLYKKKVSKLK